MVKNYLQNIIKFGKLFAFSFRIFKLFAFKSYEEHFKYKFLEEIFCDQMLCTFKHSESVKGLFLALEVFKITFLP